MPPQPHACPFCPAKTVSIVANFHDSLTAYRCGTCQQVFYTMELRCDATPAANPSRPGSANRELSEPLLRI